MKKINLPGVGNLSRRDFLQLGLYGVGLTGALPLLLEQTSQALTIETLFQDTEKQPERIAVVLELSGGNDGLNTVVPHGLDEYYRARPTIGIKPNEVLALDDEFGFNPRLEGMERLFKDGNVAVIHGCGYPNPNLSHFTSMEYWHTGVPNGADPLGWLGRFADGYSPEPKKNLIVNIAKSQSLAVKSAIHAPIVFGDPENFTRIGSSEERAMFEKLSDAPETGNPTLNFLDRMSRIAADSSILVREACARYATPVDYGNNTSIALDLQKIAALIEAGFPTRIYYLSFGGFDTHADQTNQQRNLLLYVSDALRAFVEDLDRIGRSDDVAIMVFTEFGRRVEENASRGTDHGTATPMFMIGNRVKGGLYEQHPSLTDLDVNGNLKMTTDFRRVYASLIQEWMGYADTQTILKGDFATIGLFV